MTIIINDIWSQFNKEILSQDNTDFSRKIMAINAANEHLVYRWMQIAGKDTLPKELLSPPTNMTNTRKSNQITMPSDFLRIDDVWYKSGGTATDTIVYTALVGANPLPGDIVTGSDSGGEATVLSVDLSTSTLTVAFSPLTTCFFDSDILTPASGLWTAAATGDTFSTYIPIPRSQFREWNTFVQMNTSMLFNPSMTGNYFGYFSINNGVLYLDRRIQDASTNIIRITYWKRPAAVSLTDSCQVSITSGNLNGATTMVGAGSLVTGTVLSSTTVSVAATVYIDYASKSGSYQVPEAVTFYDQSGAAIATGTLTSYQNLYQPLQWSDTHKLLFIQACVYCYFNLRKMDEAIQHDVVLENMIKMYAYVNSNDTASRWRFSD